MTKTIARYPLLGAGLALALTACNQQSGEAPADQPDTADAPAIDQRAAPTAPPLVPPGEEADATPLTPAGFGPHVVGEPLASAGPSAPTEITPRAADNCRLYRDPNLPGVNVMTDGAVVVRVSVQAPSTIISGAGIRVGSSEAEVRAVYPELRQEPHEQVLAPGKNLYTAAAGDDGLRFEIGPDGTVTEMHGGAEPALSRPEGCA